MWTGNDFCAANKKHLNYLWRMKVSVLVPVYNGEAFLAECLESILAQDFADMEILIADDASTDGSAALVERYAARDSRIRWWKNPGNPGLGRNFNCCLRAAKGEYIKYVHQDDKLISRLAIRKMVEALDNHPEVSLVNSMSQVLDEHSRVIELRKYFKPGVMDGRQVIVKCLERMSNMIGEPSVVMFRREQAARGFNEQLHHWLDLDLWFYLLEQGRFAYVAEPLCAFRRHAAQQSEIDRHSGVVSMENLALFKHWFERLGLQESMWRQALFTQIYDLRKKCGAEAESSIKGMMHALGRNRYVLLWCRRKISRPFERLINSVKRRANKLNEGFYKFRIKTLQLFSLLRRAMGRSRRIRIEVITMMYNEAFLAPLFMRHYAPWVDEFTIFYSESLDDTRRELEITATQCNVKSLNVIPFEFPQGFDDMRKIECINRAVNKSSADFVICVDADEFVHPWPFDGTNPRDELAKEFGDVVYCTMFQSYRHVTDTDIDRTKPPLFQRRHGSLELDLNVDGNKMLLKDSYTKPCIVRPKSGAQFEVGCHRLLVPKRGLTKWRGAHWGRADRFCLLRCIRDRRDRLSEENRLYQFGVQHFNITEEQILAELKMHENDPRLF